MRRRLKLCRTESDTQRGSLNKLFHDLQAGKLSSDSPSSNVRLRECARSAAARICTSSSSSSLRGALLWKQLLWIRIRHTWTWRKAGNLQISVKETNTELNYCSSWSPGEVAGPLKVLRDPDRHRQVCAAAAGVPGPARVSVALCRYPPTVGHTRRVGWCFCLPVSPATGGDMSRWCLGLLLRTGSLVNETAVSKVC